MARATEEAQALTPLVEPNMYQELLHRHPEIGPYPRVYDWAMNSIISVVEVAIACD